MSFLNSAARRLRAKTLKKPVTTQQQQQQQASRSVSPKSDESSSNSNSIPPQPPNESESNSNNSSSTSNFLKNWAGSNDTTTKTNIDIDDEKEQQKKRAELYSSFGVFIKNSCRTQQKKRSKATSSAQMLRLLRNRKCWIVYDLETSGFSASQDQILEIGAKKTSAAADGRRRRRANDDDDDDEDNDNFFLNRCRLVEGKKIHPCASKVNGLFAFNTKNSPLSVSPSEAVLNFATFMFCSGNNNNNSDDADFDDFDDKEKLQKKSDETLLIAHNSTFDNNFLFHQICRDREAIQQQLAEMNKTNSTNNESENGDKDEKPNEKEELNMLQKKKLENQLFLLNLLFAHVECVSSQERSVCTKRLFHSLFPNSASSTLESSFRFLTGKELPRTIRNMAATSEKESGSRRKREEEDNEVVKENTTNSVDVAKRVSNGELCSPQQQQQLHHNARDDVNATVEVVRRLAAYMEDLNEDDEEE